MGWGQLGEFLHRAAGLARPLSGVGRRESPYGPEVAPSNAAGALPSVHCERTLTNSHDRSWGLQSVR